MRPVLHGDISAAARALLSVPPAKREGLCFRLLRQAEIADRFVMRYGNLHPRFGNGSLMAVARLRNLPDEPNFDDLQYCSCFETVLRCLIRHRVSQRRS